MDLDATAEFIECAVGGLFEERAGFAGTSFEFEGGLASQSLFLLDQAGELAIGDASGNGFKFLGDAVGGLFGGGEIHRLRLAWRTLRKFLEFLELDARIEGQFVETLDDLVGPLAGYVVLLFGAACNLTKAGFEGVENLLRRRIEQPVQALLGHSAGRAREKRAQIGDV